MDERFVPAAEAFRKLRFARNMNTAVYLYGATGYGKTRLVQEYLQTEEVRWLSATESEWDLSDLKEKVVVLDDLHLLRGDEKKKVISNLIMREDLWVVMIGRMKTPSWMATWIPEGKLVVVSEENLSLSGYEILKIAGNEQIELKAEELERLVSNCYGNAYVIAATLNLMRSGEVLDDSLEKMIQGIFVQNLEDNIIPQWDISLQEFLMEVSVVDSFTIPMAVTITGDDSAAGLIEEAIGSGNFIESDGEYYRIREFMLWALRSKAVKVLGQRKYNRCLNNAGLYYEMQGNIIDALKMYEISNNKENIRELLIRNGRRHFGDGHFYELRKYYLALTDQEAEESPVLMSALCMLYSVLMNPEKSDYWYEKLKENARIAKGGEKIEVNRLLLYLDIGLPHRGTVDMIDIMKRTTMLLASGGFKLPEFSVTSNVPSAMNGGKDFCNWSKRDVFLAETIGKMVERLLGDFGRGLIHAALCESFYEKGGKDTEVAHHALFTQMDVEGGGKLELLFVTVGIQIRLAMLMGNVANAMQLLDSFENRVRQAKKDALLPGIDALRCRCKLMTGELEFAKEWMNQAPNEMLEFWPLERYRYMTKLLCYISMGQNREAIHLLQRMLYYADVNKRTYIRMESELLLAIVQQREKLEWKQTLLDALKELTDYRFTRMISEKGEGILPLLKEIKEDYLSTENADAEWFANVLKETRMIAERYPGYLKADSVKASDFSETAMVILKKQAEGFRIKEIADALFLSERTVKYHAAENYRKLGAKGKTDAVQKARSMNLI